MRTCLISAMVSGLFFVSGCSESEPPKANSLARHEETSVVQNRTERRIPTAPEPVVATGANLVAVPTAAIAAPPAVAPAPPAAQFVPAESAKPKAGKEGLKEEMTKYSVIINEIFQEFGGRGTETVGDGDTPTGAADLPVLFDAPGIR